MATRKMRPEEQINIPGRTLQEYVSPTRLIHRSASVEHDGAGVESLETYIVSPLAREAVFRVLGGLTESHGNRAWSIIGPYGSGKSSFANYVSALIGDGPRRDLARSMFYSAWPEHRQQMDTLLALFERPISVIPVSGGTIGLPATLINALTRHVNSTASRSYSKEMTDAISLCEQQLQEGALRSNDLIDVLRLLTTEIARRDKGGVLLIIDEAGKFFERAAQNPSGGELLLLQELAEACSRTQKGAKFGIMITLHQSVNAYAEGVPLTSQREWLKVSGRFEQVPFLESPRHLLRLTARAISTPLEASELEVMKAQSAVIDRAVQDGIFEGPLTHDLMACRPLNPVVSRILGPLFRQRLGQNERSIFAFLGSGEPFGFRAFLAQTSHDTVRGYTLADLYDYVVANTAVRLTATVGDRTWSAAEQALRKYDSDGTVELHRALIKAVAILGVVGPEVGLRADTKTLAYGLERSTEAVEMALEQLARQNAIIFKATRGAYAIWDGSDINVGELVRKQRELVRKQGSLGSRLASLIQVPPIVATRHYLQSGTLRVLDLAIRDPHADSYNELTTRLGADGTLVLILPDDTMPDDKIVKRLKRHAPPTCNAEKPLIFAVPAQHSALLSHALDYLAASEVRKTTLGLESDPIARRDLEELVTRAYLGLVEAIEHRLVESTDDINAQTRFVVNDEEIDLPVSLAELASRTFDATYRQSPIVRNEMLNRNHLSTAAAAARRTLLGLMVENASVSRLGMEGFPPEYAMYASVLQGHLHRKSSAGLWAWSEPTASHDPALHEVWSCIRELLNRSAMSRCTLPEVYGQLGKPPFGIREGLAPVLLMAFVLSMPGRVMLYEDNSLLPNLTEDVLQRLLRRPESFELQLVSESRQLQALIATYMRALGAQEAAASGLLSVVRRLLREVSDLSSYAQATQRISEPARRIRSAIKAARDPLALVTGKIPEALGLAAIAPSAVGNESGAVLEERLRDALKELGTADHELDAWIVSQLARVFGYQEGNLTWAGSLISRAQALQLESIPMVARPLVLALGALATPTEASLALAAGSATVGKNPRSWTDGDCTAFALRVSELGRSIMAAEALALAQGRLSNQSGADLVRIGLLDSSGNESQVYLRKGADGLPNEARSRIDAVLSELGPLVRDEAALYLLRALVRLNDTTTKENS